METKYIKMQIEDMEGDKRADNLTEFGEHLLIELKALLEVCEANKSKQQSNCNLPQVINSDQLHTCKYCGAETTQPDEQCYKAEKKASVCDLNRLSESCETAHQLRGCKYCKYHREQTDL